MRHWLLWAILLCLEKVATAFDLNAVRLATSAPATNALPMPAGFYEWYGRFLTPLPMEAAPLCGNGVLDDVAAYKAFHAANPGVWLRYGGRNRTVAINEVCDDGNRFDGDGCAADCASMDGMVGPCALAFALGAAETYEFLEFVDNATLLVVTNARIFAADPGTLTPTASITDNKTFTATVGYADPDRVWLFDAGTGILWVLPRAQGWVPAQWNRAPTMLGRRRFEWLPFVESGVDRGLLLLCVDTMHLLQVRNSTATALTALAQVPGPPPGDDAPRIAQFFIGQIDMVAGVPNYQIHCLLGSLHSATFQLAWNLSMGAPLVYGGTPWAYENPMFALGASMGLGPWLGFFMAMAPRLTTQSVTSMVPALRYTSAVEQAPYSDVYEGQFGPMEGIQVAPFAMFAELSSMRALLVENSEEWLQGIGDPLARSIGQRRSTFVCAGGSTPCLLDIPVCADLFSRGGATMYGAASNPNQTYYAALVAAAAALPASASWDDIANAAAPGQICPTSSPVRQQLRHPVTGALWLVRGGNELFDVGRRGTQALFEDGTCAPSYSGACAPGAWSPPRLACRPCAQGPSTNDEALAWRQRCATQGARRLLQLAPADVVALALVSTSLRSTDAAAQFLRDAVLAAGLTAPNIACSAATAGGAWTFASNCTLTLPFLSSATETNGSALVLRALAASVANRTDTAFLSPPRVTAAAAAGASSAPPSQSTDGSMMVWIAAIVGGAVVVVVIIATVFWCRAGTRYTPLI